MKVSALLVLVTLMASAVGASAGEVEVMHPWGSTTESRSLVELKAALAGRGHVWKDTAVPDDSGLRAAAIARERVRAGSPPGAAVIRGTALAEMAELKAFANLDTMANFERWYSFLPQIVQDQIKHKGHYVAAPVSIRRTNWLWINQEVLRRAGVSTVPASVDDLLKAAERVRAAGLVPLAHGGQPWEDLLLFENVVLGVGGIDFYNKAFIQLDADALMAADMRRSLDVFRQLRNFASGGAQGPTSAIAAADLLANGKAAFLIGSDSVKARLLATGRVAGRDFTCTPMPGTAGAFSYVVDTLAMFQLKSWEAQKAQGYLAFLVVGKEFQEKFNQREGGLPARHDVAVDKFDDCAKEAKRAFTSADQSGKLVPSVALDMALPSGVQAAFQKVVSDYAGNERMSAQEAMAALVSAVAPPAAQDPKKDGDRRQRRP